MKVTLERGALLKALGHVYRVVEKRNTIPILSNVLLRARDGKVDLKATDLDMEVTESVGAEVSVPGATTLPAHVLHDIVRKFPEGCQVSFEIQGDASTVVVKGGRSRFSLQALSERDFPNLAAGDMPHSFTMRASDLSKLIEDCQFAISNEETRYYLNGIYVHAAGDRMRFVSTDGHRLARSEVACPEGAGGMAGVIIPRKAVSEIKRLVDEGGEDASVQCSTAKARFTVGGVVLTTKLIDGTFPDYERVIPKGNDRALRVDRQTLKAAIDRVSTISTERGRAVRFSMAEGRLVLNANSPDAGSSNEEMEADYSSAEMDVGFNSKYVLDIVAHLGGETTEFMLSDPGSPAIVRDHGAEDSLFVLMPMRI